MINTALFDAQEMVRDFHYRFGLPSPAYQAFPDKDHAELWAKLIREEATETSDALAVGDLVETIDGLCDLIYVALGCAVVCGVNLSPLFEEVHRTNMAKVGGGIREDGKILKPPGWRPPDIAGLLAQQVSP